MSVKSVPLKKMVWSWVPPESWYHIPWWKGWKCRFSLSGPKIEKMSLESFRPCSEECFSTPGWLDIPALECCKIRFLKSFPATERALTEAFIQQCKVNSKDFTYKWKIWKFFFTIFDLSEFWSKFNVYYMKNVLFYHNFSILMSVFQYLTPSRPYGR